MLNMKENHVTIWTKKLQHGYLFRTRKSVNKINEDLTNTWLKKSSFSSHVECHMLNFNGIVKSKKIANGRRKSKLSSM